MRAGAVRRTIVVLVASCLVLSVTSPDFTDTPVIEYQDEVERSEVLKSTCFLLRLAILRSGASARRNIRFVGRGGGSGRV